MDFARLFRARRAEAAPAASPPAAQIPAAEPPAAEVQPTAEAQPVQTSGNNEEIEQGVIEALRTVYDPEIPVNIYELGLVYDINIDPAGKVTVRMTLTSPGCPVAGSLIPEVEYKASQIPGVSSAKVDLVWDPPWDPSMMSEAAKLQLGMF